MYKAVIFDMDGTLIRTPLTYIRKTLQDSLRKFKKVRVKRIEAKEFWYKPNKSKYLYEKFKIKNMDEFWKEFIKKDAPSNREKVISLYNDVYYLWRLKEKYNLKYAALTNAHPEITKIQKPFLGEELIEIIVNSGIYNGIKPKPDPEGVFMILKKFGVKYSEALFVGDSENDIMCARNVPMRAILIDRNEHRCEIGRKDMITSFIFLEEIIEDDY